MSLTEILLAPVMLVIGGVAIYFKAKYDARQDAKAKQAADAAKTKERMDAVVVDDDAGALRNWLRERGK